MLWIRHGEADPIPGPRPGARDGRGGDLDQPRGPPRPLGGEPQVQAVACQVSSIAGRSDGWASTSSASHQRPVAPSTGSSRPDRARARSAGWGRQARVERQAARRAGPRVVEVPLDLHALGRHGAHLGPAPPRSATAGSGTGRPRCASAAAVPSSGSSEGLTSGARPRGSGAATRPGRAARRRARRPPGGCAPARGDVEASGKPNVPAGPASMSPGAPSSRACSSRPPASATSIASTRVSTSTRRRAHTRRRMSAGRRSRLPSDAARTLPASSDSWTARR